MRVSPSQQRHFGVSEIASYGLIVGAVVLGWQMVIQPLIQRAPVETAIGVAPTSPMALRRAAESELAAGRIENAVELSRQALVRSPFDVRALRVVGLTESRLGRDDQADEILTLAGNWSLRDDPAHAWLVERRLKRGDYASSFAHADTLVRRREDIQPQVFRLFTVAATEEPQRVLPVIADLLAAWPPWRAAYLASLTRTPADLQIFANLSILLEAGPAPLTSYELQYFYQVLLGNRHFLALSAVRQRLNRPPPNTAVTNSGFSDTAAPEPFQWRLFQKAGIVAEIVADDLQPSNAALRVEYDGFATGVVAEQLVSLPPGAYRFTADVRLEAGGSAPRLAWALSCATTGVDIGSVPTGVAPAATNGWTTLSGRLDVPNSCPAQWLRLETRADDGRSPTAVWFDRIAISPAG